MNLIPVTDVKFKKYGRVVKDVDFKELIEEMKKTPCPEDVVYVASVPELEALPVFYELVERTYGEMPVQIGYCNGKNKLLNALEYHRSSEIDVAVSDLVLMLGKLADITEDFQYDSANVEAFLVPAGTAVEVFADTLHYAPCNTEESGFRMVVILPKGTNLDLMKKHENATDEEKLLFGTNKWVIAHPDAKIEGAFNGIIGENLKLD
ncbi:DUF4867 family protein [Blautia sp. OF03-15BH]|uniref:DUF4867 family protein n=1 Tax=Blautia sp. OF03-15BH TaxID=2292287 RepID=UPI000E4EBAEF|nr:DUF4867 family protein [Blautia sp. OF03-15BH]RGY02929.1 DUF4867 family protein [Blautia sp. OF03-15BH]